MTVLQAFILGLVQGLTEFLPVSSSGHLVLFQNIFGLSEGTLFFDTMVHVGTLAAVIIVYWQDVLAILRRPFSPTTWKLLLALVPTILVGLFLKDFVESAFSGRLLGFCFLITAAALFISERVGEGRKRGLKSVTYPDAAMIGIAQSIAILPGISRSGSTIAMGLGMGLHRSTAAKFSFLLSIPTILGSLVLEVKDVAEAGFSGIGADILPIIVGTVAAAVSGYFAIRLLLAVLKKGRLKWFALYVGVLGLFVILDQFLLHVVFK